MERAHRQYGSPSNSNGYCPGNTGNADAKPDGRMVLGFLGFGNMGTAGREKREGESVTRLLEMDRRQRKLENH